jgi:hypothetical protein
MGVAAVDEIGGARRIAGGAGGVDDTPSTAKRIMDRARELLDHKQPL